MMLRGLARRWTNADQGNSNENYTIISPEIVRELAERTVCIKPDHPDDDKPPYTKEEALAIKAGKQSVHQAESKAGLFRKLRLNRSTFDGGEMNEVGEEGKDAVAKCEALTFVHALPPQQISDENSPSPPVTSATAAAADKRWHDERSSSHESAIVSSESGDEDEGGEASTRKNSHQGLLSPLHQLNIPATPTEAVPEKPRRRPSALKTFIRRHSLFRRQYSKTTISTLSRNSSNHLASHDKDSWNTEPSSNKHSSSTACPTSHEPPCSSSSSPPPDDKHPAHPPSPLSRLTFLNPFNPLDHARRAREGVSAADWCAAIAHKYPLLFTNNAAITAYLDVPGPSDKLARLIDDTPFTDPVDAEGREEWRQIALAEDRGAALYGLRNEG
ncbi:Zinc finger DHHC-type palmitoyltransferase protein [Macrophomina phaseolina MS6]|uniref:Zinc finger DHHC-type palmitoyltransferase protein n=1 Tax=Macrophomina phaseolina (strain MS6) TaxID=1126212 RepID=K2S5M6_MACPH|nr:Zinc finger DHHC-type palmitoyltransferase protein [Macrophomina phaseolina MS6]